MRITVRLFASQREMLGRSSLPLDLPDGTTAAGALASLVCAYAGLAGHGDSIAFAVNREHAAPETTLHEGDELALLPPVAGG